MNENTIKRFWSKVKKTPICWVWQASKRDKGYGAFVWVDDGGKTIQGRAHRFAYELLIGKIPLGLCVLHKCDNPACVNPKHLFLGTKADNNKDMFKKNRNVSGAKKTPVEKCKYKRGKSHHAYRYPFQIIEKIRKDRSSGMSFGNLSKKYTISVGYIYRICKNNGRNHE